MQGNDVNTQLKYREAISLYANTKLSIKDICEQTSVGFSALSAYLSRHHRDLILKRHNLTHLSNVKLRGEKGQTTVAHNKYKEAIAACDSQEYIEYNISQIARIFDVNCSSLASQLRRHYSDIVPRRELARQRIGITINLQYGARKWSKESYAKAVEMLHSSDMTIEEVANACDVSYAGFREHILAYYPQITSHREIKRSNATGQKKRGKRNGNWTIHEPKQATIEKYEKAIEMYHTTSASIEDIVRMTHTTLGGFQHYLKTWHSGLIVKRRGYDTEIDLSQTKRYKRSTAEKYADAIKRLKSSSLPTAQIASEFGLNPETFRMYLREHYPELATMRGMVKVSNGKTVSNLSAKKYAEALHLYETTSESLKSIAQRLGLTYNSVGGFIRRNYPEAIQKHDALLISSHERFKDGIVKLKNSDATIKAVMKELGYNEHFRTYIKEKHPELLDRNTVRKRCFGTQTAANKYAVAIECLKSTTDTMKDIADRFGLNVSSFRKYLYKHAPEVLELRRNKGNHKSDDSVSF